jgi:bifunctional non-homologous end joining protein LigD
VTDFDQLHNGRRTAEAVAYAFDLMMLDGEDIRTLPWLERRNKLKRLLGRRALGLVYNDHFLGSGPDIYEAACRMGLEGIVSKLIDAPYRSGKSRAWLKVKNPEAPGSTRFKE